MTASPGNKQRGGFLVGLIVGLLVGLALALGVALYVTKAPNPFVTKVPPRSAVQDAAEQERNRNWDPNAPLAGRTAMPSPPPAAPGASPPVIAGTAAPGSAASGPNARFAKAPTTAGAASAPAGRASQPLSTGTGADPFTYFVQAGAYARTEDAEQQRAKLAMLGIESRLTERDQSGRTVYRVRVGPFDRKEDADRAKEKLSEAGVDSALVRVQK
jgi:cell division protein FtsN